MFNGKYLLVLYILNSFLVVGLLFAKTADEEIKSIDRLRPNGKNFSSHENTLARPQATSILPVTEIYCKDENLEDISSCPSGVECSKLGGDCLNCEFNCSCIYGQTVNVTCTPKDDVYCIGPREFLRNMTCQYCYQTPSWDHDCSGSADCPAVSSPRRMFKTNCSVKSEVICLGNRNFPKRIPCNWTSGYQWSTVLLLSITLGGFGADRFYLGHWQEGIGKLFSFGGLGVWTIIDVILIAIRYLGPANESLYI
ncbi:TM2 domain-containing protein almondex [Armadillidium nasatum]|uniref:TM2 domain-containing protein almondex n=1 Tax=Armadillidium nasatum TaxID=96803 RepID=A0A5N5SZ52_9CRUS|nr:TM2 domain-containing protein almondex [Armadillidium nasatum]